MKQRVMKLSNARRMLVLIGLVLSGAAPAQAAETLGALIKPSLAQPAAAAQPVTVGLDKSVQIDLPADVR
ncbi:MAG TPA: hypothetical protein VH858_12590, partial [Hyphomicrobiales bacterium]